MAEAHTKSDAFDYVVDAIAAGLMPAQSDALRQLFKDNGAREPTIIWSPEPQELLQPGLSRFASVCDKLSDRNGRITETTFDLERFGGLADWLMLVAPDVDGYRYLYYGAGIADHYGRDMTGQTTAEFGGHIQTFFEAVYRAAAARFERVLTEHEPPLSVFVRCWRRLVVPVLTEDGRETAFFAVINLPENELRAGLDLISEPVFVLDADQVVYYANTAARSSFALAASRAPGPTMLQLTGIDLGPLPPLSDIFTDTRLADRVELSLVAGITERRRIMVSAAEHRGRLYYVVMIQPLEV